MSKVHLYCGLVRNNKWYNYADVIPLVGGTLAMLDSVDRTGGSRLLNLIKGSIKNIYTEDGEEYELKNEDYPDIYVADAWKIGYEQIKIKKGTEYPVIPESFYCNRCSAPKLERFTEVNESWTKLIEDGFVDEIYLQNHDATFDVSLPNPIVIQSNKTIAGGSYDTITRRHTTIGDLIKIQKDPTSMDSEAALTCAMWDATIIKVDGMSERDFNIMRRVPGRSFTKEYVANSQENIDAMEQSDIDNIVGIDARYRKVTCKYCSNEIGGGLDFTNFFLPLLPKKYVREHIQKS